VRALREFDQWAFFFCRQALTIDSPHIRFFSARQRKPEFQLSTLLVAVLTATIIASRAALPQIPTKVASVTPSSASQKTPLTIHVALQQGETIEKVFLAYRAFGSGDYDRLEMDLVGNTASATIPAQEVLPPFVEYYLVLLNRNGLLESYPLSEGLDPFEIPPGKTLQIRVSGEAEADAQIVFLSPDPWARIAADDLLISVSLLRADTVVVKRATQILLDGVDISEGAMISDDILVVAPENSGITLHPGTHRLTVRLFNRDGGHHHSASITFTISGSGVSLVEPTDQWRYNTSIQIESRHEDIGSVGMWYNRGNIMVSGFTGMWRINGSTFLTSDERPDRQAQNRYFVGVESPLFRVGFGDAYPSFPNLVLSGKRVRGLVSALRLDWFNLDLALGKTTRSIEGSLIQVIGMDSLAQEQQRDPNSAYAPINDSTWGKYTYGTFSRDLFAIRPSFGSGEYWQFGLTWLKSKDETGSIKYGTRPQENFVLGTDFVARFDEKRLELSGQGAFSAFNSDISSGNFTDAHIDSVYENEAAKIKHARDILENVITVNDNLRPLRLGTLATAAFDVALSLNYFDNTLKLIYLFRGSDYNSFGQTFLRKDIRGINITDRVRLVQNRVLATAGVEFLKDNTAKSKIATTSFANLNFAVSYFPGVEYPNTTVGFTHYTSKNYLDRDSPYAIDDATNRFFVQSTYDFGLSGRHTASFNLSTSNRDDNSLRQYNVDNVTLAFGLNTKYSVPLQTNIDISINTNSLPKLATQDSSGRFDYTTFSLNARYALIQDILSIMVSSAPSFGDLTRTAWDANVEWIATQEMRVELQFSLYNNRGFSNDTIWSLRYWYDI
jgi:hypothetical protein